MIPPALAMNAPPDSPRRRIWIVDDSPLEAREVGRALAGQYEVETFHDGSAMLERLGGGAGPDALVLDQVMPGLSGLEICRFLRADPARAELPVLLLTGQQSTREVVEGLAAGANDYVAKPYVAEELLARVGALVRSRVLRERAARAEAELRQQLDYHPDALFDLDAAGAVTYANLAAARLLGRAAPGELLGQPLSALLPGLQLASPRPDEPLPDLALGAELYAPAVQRRPGSPERVTVSLRDVTAKRRADARRLDFYSMVAHDLRSPLQSVLLRLHLLSSNRREPLPAWATREVEKVGAQVRELGELLNDFLDLARMEATAFTVEREPVDLAEVLRSTGEALAPLAEAGRVALEVEAAPGAGVSGDERRLRQAASNLLSNAIKFTPPGGRVEVRLRPEGGGYRCEFRDTGVGIAPEALPGLFHRYARARHARTVAGTGLGLMIVREVVEAHGGTVGVESQPGRGSTFWFTLPAG